MPLINAYSTLRTIPALEFRHQLLNRRDLSDAELPAHLQGFMGYIMQGEEGMTQSKYHLLRHIERVKNHLSLEVDDDDLDNFAVWATDANAVCFLPDGSVRDPAGNVLFHPSDEASDDAEIPFPADALQRRSRVFRELEKRGVRVPATLPPVIGELEVEMRPGSEVAERILALFAVALRAESLGSGDDISLADLKTRLPLGIKAASPAEKAFLAAKSPSQQDVVNFAWRYEALNVLQWSLGLHAELPFPSAICNVPKVARAALDNNTPGFIEQARLRPVKEILDSLDLHFRLHWSARQAGIDKQPPPASLEPGVITERHYALNWLVRFEDKDWDEVDTPT